MGSHPIAIPALQWLRKNAAEEVDIVAVVTQPDRRTGRGMKMAANPIKQWALAEGFPVFQPEKADSVLETQLQELGCEMILVMAYGQILKKSLIVLPRLGTLNLHASLLPALRGASPLHTAIAIGEKQSGVSLMQIEPKMDAGPVVDQETVTIESHWTTDGLSEAIAKACVPLLRRNLNSWIEGSLGVTTQNESDVTYCRILTKEDAALDFKESAASLSQRIRAFQPWPGTSFPHREQEIKIRAASYSDDIHDKSSGFVEVTSQGTLAIYCGKGILYPLELQKPGSKAMPVAEFLRGYSFEVDEVLSSRVMAPLVSPFPKKKGRQG